MSDTIGKRAFLALTSEILRSVVEPRWRQYHERQHFSLLQLHYGEPKIHYELWIQRRERRLEVGLHFEAGPDLNRELLRRMLDHEGELREQLGDHIEFEDWTRTWTRVHETLPGPRLDLELAEEAAVRLAAWIAATHHLIADVAAGHFEAGGTAQPTTAGGRSGRSPS